ncbi:MAG: thiol-disulfide oxidoreductase-associated membrane protein CcdA2 [Patescibacteria group bacterium]|nr:MAG: thiol-disulfide oxidoreductase-associated membrane protein CcdA2 [Patescibacteria group bacterium]
MTLPKSTKTTYILWAVAGIAIFALITIFGFKIFYGFVVPQAQAISQLGIFIILGFAFVAGIAAFFSPCPFAVFPAYIAYYLNSETSHANEATDKRIKLRHAIKIGSIVSLGIFSFYLVVGVILAIFGTALASYTNWLKLAIIPLFFIFGIMLVLGKSFGTEKLDKLTGIVAKRAKGGKHFLNMYLFGVVYGIAAAACHLPILLVLALVPILAGNVLVGFATFVAYALGASFLLVAFTVLASRKKKFLINNLGLYGYRVKKVFGFIFILTGVYLVSFYIIFAM